MRFLDYLKKFETVIYGALIVLLSLVVLFSLFELAYIIYRDFFILSEYHLENYEILRWHWLGVP